MTDQQTTPTEEESTDSTVSVRVAQRGPSVGAVALATAGVLAVIFISYVIYRTLFLLLLLFLALLVATAIEPVVTWLRRGPFSRSMGILVVYVSLFLIIGFVIYIMSAVFFSQLGSFATGVEARVGEMDQGVERMEDGFLKQQLRL